jgi:hypothetical protein
VLTSHVVVRKRKARHLVDPAKNPSRLVGDVSILLKLKVTARRNTNANAGAGNVARGRGRRTRMKVVTSDGAVLSTAKTSASVIADVTRIANANVEGNARAVILPTLIVTFAGVITSALVALHRRGQSQRLHPATRDLKSGLNSPSPTISSSTAKRACIPGISIHPRLLTGYSYRDLLPGEGAAMQAFLDKGQRIPRRGEIGMDQDKIAALEGSGYVMSGSRHVRMNAVRLRKEGQVISADEKRAMLLQQREDWIEKEGAIISQFKEMMDERLMLEEKKERERGDAKPSDEKDRKGKRRE